MYTPELGQTILLEPTGNFRRTRERHIYPYIVVKIGRKYIYAAHSQDTPKHAWVKIDRANKDGMSDDYNAGYKLWDSEQEFQEDVQYNIKLGRVREYFSSVPFSVRYKKPDKASMNAIYDILTKAGYLPGDQKQKGDN